MKPAARPRVIALIAFALAATSGVADDAPAPDAEGVAFFEAKVRPVLVEACYKCHGAEADKAKGNLRLDSREGLLAGGDRGPAIVPGKPEESLLIEAIRHDDDALKMPPKAKLTDGQIADLEAWIKRGAPDPRRPETPATAVAAIDWDKAGEFWSFRPVADPAATEVADRDWPRNEIDRFVLAKLEAKGLRPAPDADRRALIRRATFDLTGLPPSPEEVEAFLNDREPMAYDRVVDRLLDSPHYGERWGRHWLDLVRYADTSGDNSDFPVPSAVKYRDYVIASFNRDKPFDQFLREQVAGDLMPAGSDEERVEQIVATGYLAISRRFGSTMQEHHLTIEDTIDNLGKAVLGLSVSCARCHDHKFDPIPQADYYALYGIFDSTKYAFPGTELFRHTKDFTPIGPPEEAEALRKFEAEMSELDARIRRLNNEKREPKDGRTLLQIKTELAEARDRQRDLEDDLPMVDKAYAVAEGKPKDAKVHRKGDPERKGDEVRRGFLQVLGGQKLPDGSEGSGRRELAVWLTDPSNPLTARVLVNRVWQHHFGRGIVATPNDFGSRGQPPSHPELLDWLATRFVEGGWSIKALHRRIMLSRIYQTACVEDSHATTIDPDDDLLWTFRRRRLSAEEVRDAMLAVAGMLDRTPGGTHPFPPETEWRYTQHKPFVAVYPTDKRSVYLMQQRLKKHPLLEVFDGADTNVTTPDRPLSTTAIQALYLLNDPFVHRAADELGVRVGLAFTDEADRIDYAHKLAFGRPATGEEVEAGRDYLRACREQLAESGAAEDRRPRGALASYARVLLSSNEFLFVE